MNITDYPMKSWSRLCKSRNEDLYDLLMDNGVPIWHTRFPSEADTQVSVKTCQCCGTPLEFKHMNGRWWAVLCQCVKDGKNQLTVDKLRCFFRRHSPYNHW